MDELTSIRVQIFEIDTTEQLREALRIREQVFVEEQGIPRDLDLDGRDPDSIHLLLEVDGQKAGTGRLTPEHDGSATFSRIAVLPAYRGRGHGRSIIGALEDLAQRRNLSPLVLTPHAYLEDFYRGLGYSRLPDEVPAAGPHRLIKMAKNCTA